MKVNLKVNTRVLAKPQELEVDDAEAKRLMMLGVAEPVKKVEKAEPKVEQPKEEQPKVETEPTEKKTKRTKKQ